MEGPPGRDVLQHSHPRDSERWRAIANHVHRHRDLWALALFCALAFSAYGHSLGGFFLADDFPLVGEFHNNPLAVLGEFVRKAESWEVGRKYRPLWCLSFYVDGLMWGTNPFGYRLTNLLLHVGCAWLVYRFCAKATRSPGYALAAGAVFCCFPANYEGVMWVAARGDSLSLLFQLMTLSMFVTTSGELAPTRTRWWAMVPAALALSSKESAIALLPTLLVLTWLGGPSKGWRAVWDAVRACLPVILVLAVYVITRHVLLGPLAGTWNAPSGSSVATLLEQRYALVRLLVAPVRVVAHSTLMFYLVEVLSYVILLLGAVACVIRSRGSRDWLVFCLAWFLLAQGPLLFLFTDPQQQLDVRYAYVPAAAYSALLTHAMFSLLAWARAGTRLTNVLTAIVVASFLCLLVGNQQSYVRAGQLARKAHQLGLELLQRQPARPKMFIDLPARYENAWTCLNVGSHMFQPPFTEQPSLAIGFSDSHMEYDHMVRTFRSQVAGLDADCYRFEMESGRLVQCPMPRFVSRVGTVAGSKRPHEVRLDDTRLFLAINPEPDYFGQRVRVEALLVDSVHGPLLIAFKVDRL